MPFDEYSLAKKLVQSTKIAPDGLHIHKENSVSQPSQPSPSSSTAPEESSTSSSSGSISRHEDQSLREWFGRQVSRLDSRVGELENSISSKAVEWLEKEANTCRAELQHLYDRALQHSIDITPYTYQLRAIKSRLDSIDRLIQQVINRIEKAKQPLWAKVAHFVIKAADIASLILGLPQAFRSALGIVQTLLPSGNNPKLLK